MSDFVQAEKSKKLQRHIPQVAGMVRRPPRRPELMGQVLASARNRIHEAAGLSRTTLYSDAAEARIAEPSDRNRIHKCGGVRKSKTAINENLLKDLDRLLDPVIRGNPMSPLRWTFKSMPKLAAQLRTIGESVYPNAKELLITADGRGSNGIRVRLWKVAFRKLSDELGLVIHMRHCPPGTSKRNKIEHWLFCHITEN